MGSDLIVVAGGGRGLPGPVHQLMQRLLLDRQILWVDADAFFSTPLSCAADAAPVVDPEVSSKPDRGIPMRSSESPFPILTAAVVGTEGRGATGRISPLALSRRMRRAAAVLGLHRPMLWLASPWAGVLTEWFAGPAIVYQHLPVAWAPTPALRLAAYPPACADARRIRTTNAELQSARAARAEAAIAARADLILAPTVDSAARFDQHKTRLLTNGVDTDLFATPAQRALDMPWDRPVVGFHGPIDDRFDRELVIDVARRLPGWHFMLIGPVSTDVSRLRALENVSLTGCLAHEELPRYSQYWTAAIMPRRAEPAPMLDIPLQLGEYLAAGLPVVASGGRRLGRYADLVHQVGGPAAAARALLACAEEAPSCRARRRARVLGDAWSIRAGFVNRLLDKLDARACRPHDAVERGQAWRL